MVLGRLPPRLFDDESSAPTAGSAGAGKPVEDYLPMAQKTGFGPKTGCNISKVVVAAFLDEEEDGCFADTLLYAWVGARAVRIFHGPRKREAVQDAMPARSSPWLILPPAVPPKAYT